MTKGRVGRTSRSARRAWPVGLALGALALVPVACSGDGTGTGSSTTITTATTTTGSSTTAATGEGALTQAVNRLCADLGDSLSTVRSSLSNLDVASIQAMASALGTDLQQVQQAASNAGQNGGNGLGQAVDTFGQARQTLQNALASLLGGNVDTARQQAQTALDQLDTARQQAADAGADQCSNDGSGSPSTSQATSTSRATSTSQSTGDSGVTIPSLPSTPTSS